MPKIADLFVDLAMPTGGFDRSAAGADQKLQSLAGKAGKAEGSVSSLGGSFAAIAAPAAVATAAIVGMIAAGEKLFEVAKAAAEFGSKIHDAAQQTGLSTESISALKFAADNAGSSLQNITGALSKFEKTAGEAAAGSSKAAAKLLELGITPQDAINDLDKSLDTVFKRIAAAPPGVEQTRLAVDAFGKAGADLIPVILQAGGSVEEFRKKSEELGLTLSQTQADAADAAGDSLGKLGAQAEIAATKFGLGLAPAVESVAERLSEFLSNNQNEWENWGKSVGNVIIGIQGLLNELPQPGAKKSASFSELFSTFGFGAIGAYGATLAPDANEAIFQARNKRILEKAQRARAKATGGAYDDETGQVTGGKSALDQRIEADKKKWANDDALSKLARDQAKKVIDDEKKNADERKKLVDKAIADAKRYASDVKSAYKAVSDAQKGVIADFAQTLQNRIHAVDLRGEAAYLRTGESESLQKRIQDRLNAIGNGPGDAAKRDQAIIAATAGFDREQLTYSQQRLAASARDREADRLQKAVTDHDDALKENTKALQDLLAKGGIAVTVKNEAPENANVVRKPNAAATYEKYGGTLDTSRLR